MTMSGAFRDSEGVIYAYFLPPCATTNAENYSNFLLYTIYTEIRKEMLANCDSESPCCMTAQVRHR